MVEMASRVGTVWSSSSCSCTPSAVKRGFCAAM
jgi:hypothetical protein